MDTSTFRALIERLTGTPIKESSNDETQANDRLLEPIIAEDARELDCSQFNELLLLVNKDRVEPAFYRRFFPERALIRDLAPGVEHFQTVAMLRYGNFVHAYRKLSRIRTDEALEEELGELPIEACEASLGLLSRSPKLV